MSIIYLNCHGLDDPKAVSKLYTFLRRHSPSLFFLSKTKCGTLEMENIKKKSKVDGVVADARGRSGEVTLLWKKWLDVSLMSISMNHVNVTVKNFQCLPKW